MVSSVLILTDIRGDSSYFDGVRLRCVWEYIVGNRSIGGGGGVVLVLPLRIDFGTSVG
jgi:hypothetical protein